MNCKSQSYVTKLCGPVFGRTRFIIDQTKEFFFFFLIHQFITWSAMADCGSYFRNYIQKKHTNMKVRKRIKELIGSLFKYY